MDFVDVLINTLGVVFTVGGLSLVFGAARGGR